MAYLIVTYDVEEKRVNKVRKLLKRYFMWVQNSVFEGEIAEGNLYKCQRELSILIDERVDSIYFYRLENRLNYKKEILGVEKDLTCNIL
ncbi:MAG: CRISPR-associated endonuclease Cas2 [Candidatus Omnitrophica bacterium]|nr:CRISPR-associated endonuclease Cas2 [Candidatus Omnitrophota bacterium]